MKMLPVLLALAAFTPAGAPAAPAHPVIGDARPLAPHFVGLNGNVLAYHHPWREHPILLEGFRETHVQLFRYPAGTIANTWDWDEGRLDPLVPDADLIDWVVLDRRNHPDKRYPLEDLAVLHRETGTQVVFVLNMLTRDLDHSLRGLRRARDLGIPVRYVEMGNELFFNLPLESRRFPTPEDYGRISSEWITAIKAEFPGVKCAIVAGGRAGVARSDRWTERALAHCPNADAIIVHTYSPSGLIGRERRNVTAGTEGTVEGVTAESPQERQTRELELLRTPEGLARMLTTAYTAGQRHRSYPRREGMEIWMTEWNLRGDNDAARGTWANSLFIAAFYNAFLENPAITMSHYHNVVSPIFGAFHTDTRGLAHVVVSQHTTEPGSPTAGGLATALYARALNGQTSLAPLIFSDAKEIVAGDNRMPARLGWLIDGARGRTALIFNPTAEGFSLSLDGIVPPDARVEIHAAAPDTYVATRTSIPVTITSARGTLSIPGHAIVLVMPQP